MTTKRKDWDWEWDGHGGLVVNGRKVAQLVPDSGDVGRRLLSVPDYEAALLALLPEKDGPGGSERHTVACWETLIHEPCLPECEAARAALRKGGLL